MTLDEVDKVVDVLVVTYIEDGDHVVDVPVFIQNVLLDDVVHFVVQQSHQFLIVRLMLLQLTDQLVYNRLHILFIYYIDQQVDR